MCQRRRKIIESGEGQTGLVRDENQLRQDDLLTALTFRKGIIAR